MNSGLGRLKSCCVGSLKTTQSAIGRRPSRTLYAYCVQLALRLCWLPIGRKLLTLGHSRRLIYSDPTDNRDRVGSGRYKPALRLSRKLYSAPQDTQLLAIAVPFNRGEWAFKSFAMATDFFYRFMFIGLCQLYVGVNQLIAQTRRLNENIRLSWSVGF